MAKLFEAQLDCLEYLIDIYNFGVNKRMHVFVYQSNKITFEQFDNPRNIKTLFF